MPRYNVSEPRTIGQATKPMRLINLIFGLGSFRIRRKRLDRFIDFIYVAIYSQVVYFMTRTLIENCDIGVLFREDYVAVIKTVVYAYNVFFTIGMLVAASVKEKRMQRVMSVMETCNQEMENMGMPKEYRMFYLHQIYCFTKACFVIISTLWVYYNLQFYPGIPTNVKLFFTVTINMPLFLIAINDVSFYVWIKYSKLKFGQINALLRGMLSTAQNRPRNQDVLSMKHDLEVKKFDTSVNENVRDLKGDSNVMRSVKYIHLELIKITRAINDAYGLEILLTTTGSVILITFFSFKGYKIFWLRDVQLGFWQEMINVSLFITLFCTKIFLVNHACARASYEAAETGDIVCELYGPSTTKEFRAEIREFILQMIQNPLVFSVCGFFNMGHMFVQGVAGTVTTYLVILIQVTNAPTQNYINATTDRL